MKLTKVLALMLAMLLCLGCFAACGDNAGDGEDTTADTTAGEETPAAPTESLSAYTGAVSHGDYTSVYDMIGKNVTIDMVTERDGLAFVTYEGKEYELGMDFLSMAMVYNTVVPEGSAYETSEDIFNQWWKLYIQRWNYLAPEVPLYSNQYFDLYNAKIENFVTTPYWGAADAIVAASVKEGEANSVILGSATDLSGAFRNSSWGKSSPGSSDLDIQNLTSGYSTVQTDKNGAYIWNMMALAEEPVAAYNEDGTLTYTIKIKEGLKFSDGSAITAKNYIAGLLGNSTEVGAAAGGSGNSGLYFVGFDAFKAYNGTNAGEVVETKNDAGEVVKSVTAAASFAGVKLLDDYTFSVTIVADYADYYYTMGYASFGPDPLALYLGDAEIVVAEDGSCGLNDAFYAKTTKDGAEVYVQADAIVANLAWDSALPYSGPYVVSNYDASTLTATLTLNPNYPGDDARGTASIETITYVKTVTETQMDQFTSGQVDVIAGITGAAETVAALDVVAKNPEKYAETHYDRAGYGKLGIRCDFGPTAFTSVRQAIMYTINRPEFAQTFTGGYGAVVHGPYYTGYSAYKAVEDEILLNEYAYSKDSAIAVLEADGWVYNADGTAYDTAVGGIRYKKLEGNALNDENKAFATIDNAYMTVQVGEDYYMPLAINWYGTQPNEVTDQLITAWQSNENATTAIGMYITYTSTDFMTGLYGELYRMEGYGYNGTPKLNAVNFATGFTSAVYDYAFNWTINPDMYNDYQMCFVMDGADFWANYAE